MERADMERADADRAAPHASGAGRNPDGLLLASGADLPDRADTHASRAGPCPSYSIRLRPLLGPQKLPRTGWFYLSILCIRHTKLYACLVGNPHRHPEGVRPQAGPVPVQALCSRGEHLGC
jgi:hypothetical protein